MILWNIFNIFYGYKIKILSVKMSINTFYNHYQMHS